MRDNISDVELEALVMLIRLRPEYSFAHRLEEILRSRGVIGSYKPKCNLCHQDLKKEAE